MFTSFKKAHGANCDFSPQSVLHNFRFICFRMKRQGRSFYQKYLINILLCSVISKGTVKRHKLVSIPGKRTGSPSQLTWLAGFQWGFGNFREQNGICATELKGLRLRVTHRYSLVYSKSCLLQAGFRKLHSMTPITPTPTPRVGLEENVNFNTLLLMAQRHFLLIPKNNRKSYTVFMVKERPGRCRRTLRIYLNRLKPDKFESRNFLSFVSRLLEIDFFFI